MNDFYLLQEVRHSNQISLDNVMNCHGLEYVLGIFQDYLKRQFLNLQDVFLSIYDCSPMQKVNRVHIKLDWHDSVCRQIAFEKNVDAQKNNSSLPTANSLLDR